MQSWLRLVALGEHILFVITLYGCKAVCAMIVVCASLRKETFRARLMREFKQKSSYQIVRIINEKPFGFRCVWNFPFSVEIDFFCVQFFN